MPHLSHHGGGNPLPQYHLHGGERLDILDRAHQDQPVGIQAVGQQAGWVQIARWCDPEHWPGWGNASQQGGDKGRGQGGGFRVQPSRTDLVQLAQWQATAGQAGSKPGIVERQRTARRLGRAQPVPQGSQVRRQPWGPAELPDRMGSLAVEKAGVSSAGRSAR